MEGFEKVGEHYYRTPTIYTAEEFRALEAKKAEVNYFRKRANTLSFLNRGSVKPKLRVYDNLFNRLFGNGKIDIQPQGNIDITAGYQGQNVKNPTLPERARRNGGFDFDMAAQLNVNAMIGNKLRFPISSRKPSSSKLLLSMRVVRTVSGCIEPFWENTSMLTSQRWQERKTDQPQV